MATLSTPDVSSSAPTAQALFSTSLTADVIHNREPSWPLMVISRPSSSAPFGAYALVTQLYVYKEFLAPGKPTAPPFSSFWLPQS